MGFNLRRYGEKFEEFPYNAFGWHEVLKLAHKNGWEPNGTECDEPDWGGCYVTNDGQYVTDEDANAMANALQVVTQSRPEKNPDWEKQHIKEFIDFLRGGGFYIC